MDYFAAVFGEEAKFELLAYEDKDWSQEDYIGGCPGAVMQPGTFAYFQHALREPFGRYILCVFLICNKLRELLFLSKFIQICRCDVICE